ncbi:MAG: TspO/MBR family protein [Pseudomonadota bacterium]
MSEFGSFEAFSNDRDAGVDEERRQNWLVLVAFLLATMGIGGFVGSATPPGVWYTTLNQPSFTPPNWLFPPVWTALYAMIAIAGWRTWTRDKRGTAMFIWFAQFAVNLTWSPAFFGLHVMELALAIIIVMVALTVYFISHVWSKDKAAALLMVPYLSWISYAMALNGAFIWLN